LDDLFGRNGNNLEGKGNREQREKDEDKESQQKFLAL